MQNHYITWLSSADNLVLASNAPISAISVVMELNWLNCQRKRRREARGQPVINTAVCVEFLTQIHVLMPVWGRW